MASSVHTIGSGCDNVILEMRSAIPVVLPVLPVLLVSLGLLVLLLETLASSTLQQE